MVVMMIVVRKTKVMTKRLFGYHYHNPLIITMVIMAVAVGRKLPPVVNGHAHRWRNTGYDVIEDDEFDEGSTADSAYRMTSYEDDEDLDATFDPDDLAYLTRCQKQRKNERTFNVSCLSDGSYDPVQCHLETLECWCVDDNGDYLQDSIRKLPERPRCLEKVRPTFTLTLVTPSKRPSTTIGITSNNRPILEQVGDPSSNHKQLGHADPDPSGDAITYGNQLANQTRKKHEHVKDDDDDDNDDDDDDNRVKNDDNDDGFTKGRDNYDEEIDDIDDGDDDDVTQKNENKLLRRDPAYTTGLILVVILSSTIIIIMTILFIHRLKRKDEGSYTLASNAIISTIGYSVSKNTEYFA